MTKPLSLSQLVATVGDENIQVQALATSIRRIVSKPNGVTAVTFETQADMISPGDVLDPMQAKKVGLILWLPKEKVNEINRSNPLQ